MGEFELIARYFQRPAKPLAPGTDVGIGDDCALLAPRAGHQLAVSSDMLVQGRHFFPDVSPRHLGHKALAVNLSDLAACGAQPRAFLLSLALPQVQASWLAEFSLGLLALADAHHCELVGGDTTQGPLNIAITVIGDVPAGQALLRSGAQEGDDIYVSGPLGAARLGLEALRGQLALPEPVLAHCRDHLECPQPQVALGLALRGLATAAADLSDGLLGDLGHVLQASHKGAVLMLDATDALLAMPQGWRPSTDWVRTATLQGGDDYALVFCAPPSRRLQIAAAAQACGAQALRIGKITAEPGLWLQSANGQRQSAPARGFDHFA